MLCLSVVAISVKMNKSKVLENYYKNSLLLLFSLHAFYTHWQTPINIASLNLGINAIQINGRTSSFNDPVIWHRDFLSLGCLLRVGAIGDKRHNMTKVNSCQLDNCDGWAAGWQDYLSTWPAENPFFCPDAQDNGEGSWGSWNKGRRYYFLRSIGIEGLVFILRIF